MYIYIYIYIHISSVRTVGASLDGCQNKQITTNYISVIEHFGNLSFIGFHVISLYVIS